MNRLIFRLLMLSVVLGLSLLAVIGGCSSAYGPAGGRMDKNAARVGTAPQAEAAPATPEELWVIQKPEKQAAQYKGLTPPQDGTLSPPASPAPAPGAEVPPAPQPNAPRAQQQRLGQMAQQMTRGDREAQGDFLKSDGAFGSRQFRGSMAQVEQEQEPAQLPGCGQLVAKFPDKLVPVPLQHTDVKAAIAGYIATVDVTQRYANPYQEKIEAVYVFPLPTNAAVNEFLMTVGDRKIRGIIREREEAKQIYENAKRQGYVASLLTQERPNVFVQSIANIEPGKKIDVNIKYFHTLEYVDGWYEYVFPMVVGPRFNPPGYTEGVGAKAHGSAVGSTGQKTEVPYLKPNERSGHDISLTLDIDAGVKVEDVQSVNHQVKWNRPSQAFTHVVLDQADKIPNKDFVLRYKVAGKTVKSAIMAQRDEKKQGGYFTLMLFPPDSLADLPRKPLEMVFTLDVSGSMSGKPIDQAKTAVKYALNHMRPDDTFNVIRFAGQAEQMSPRALPAEKENVNAALSYIESMNAGGGTMMIEGIRKSLQVTPDPDRLRFVAFLTDGFIGNEREILAEIHNLRGPSRIFSFGVGSSTNRYLLDHMARMGQGCAAYLSLNDDAHKIMADYFERISHPALTDISIDWGGMQVSGVYPSKLPDLFVGRPVVITGRYSGTADATTVKVHGRVGGEARDIAINVNATDAAAQHKGIAPVWARAKISDLFDRAAYEANSTDFSGEIRQTALEYGLMSAYTSFVAVDSSQRTTGDHGTSVAVPVPVPEGTRYETTVPQ